MTGTYDLDVESGNVLNWAWKSESRHGESCTGLEGQISKATSEFGLVF